MQMNAASVRTYFLFGISFTYLAAFSSLFHQIPGLYGDRGILPVQNQVKQCEHSQFSFVAIKECIFGNSRPNLLQFAQWFGLSAACTMEILAIIGILLSGLQLVFACFRDSILYCVLWLLYFSCFQVGQTFLWFQWDTLLLEAGFLTVLVAPFSLIRSQKSIVPHDYMTLWLVRWLAFRLMFASGVVKLTSHCPTWWGLTALHWHFESQCIPHAGSYYFHQLPNWIKKLGVVGTYVTEMLIPPFYFVPLRHIRVFCFTVETLFMISIVISGNYNFFNLITIVLHLPLLISSDLSKTSSSHLLKRKHPKCYRAVRAMLIGCCYGCIIFYSCYLFSLKFVNGRIKSKTNFTKDDLSRVLAKFLPILMSISIFSFLIEVVTAVIRCFADYGSKMHLKLLLFIQTLIVVAIAAGMFAISLVPFAWLDRGTYDLIWPQIIGLHSKSDAYQLTHSYGLFRSMTGVGGRPEIIVEGASSINGPWLPYEFQYKPGSLDTVPSFIVPHQPRLDWQMWFAALDSYHRNPWFISFVYQLLRGNEDVLRLLKSNPFPKNPPTYIRANSYLYHFTSTGKLDKHFSRVNWWWREFDKEYLPILKNNTDLYNVLLGQGLLVQKQPSNANSKLILVEMFRFYANKVQAHIFVWAAIGTILAAKLTIYIFL